MKKHISLYHGFYNQYCLTYFKGKAKSVIDHYGDTVYTDYFKIRYREDFLFETIMDRPHPPVFAMVPEPITDRSFWNKWFGQNK